MSIVLSPSRLRRRWADADADRRRQLIVKAAMDLLSRRGQEAVSMRAVAERLSVPVMTLYTYIDGRAELRRHMTRRGFEMLRDGCMEASTLGTALGWRGGARSYIQFAVDHPNLYQLMFSTPLPDDEDEHILHSGLEPLLERVREQLCLAQGIELDHIQQTADGKALDRRARQLAGRFWIAMHGLASLAIADRLSVLEGSLEQVLDDLLEKVAPTS